MCRETPALRRASQAGVARTEDVRGRRSSAAGSAQGVPPSRGGKQDPALRPVAFSAALRQEEEEEDEAEADQRRHAKKAPAARAGRGFDVPADVSASLFREAQQPNRRSSVSGKVPGWMARQAHGQNLGVSGVSVAGGGGDGGDAAVVSAFLAEEGIDDIDLFQED
uniref:Uncharacterized protein n=1 Tax=Chromera velia CCMP2878 TaxID=1169474 RepID=A0A0K6S9E9_9ALVE|eukprot:Cvel_7857.t1-p1 / transcript=Cvel_7857.t1 / gene=Cvel_7857 / organism=Chromera_velia_CCMP2878 / gene_product=hypothetical protein / transcript_product=hypothetical protein / location=Cvel_scaffold420:77773-78702(-) / protein_length=165 / sequence_SO=supercontig / SO=protein_coding / is_pseudo=false